MALLLFLWLFFAILTAIAANARGRFALIWLFWGLIFGVFALLVVLVMRDKRRT